MSSQIHSRVPVLSRIEDLSLGVSFRRSWEHSSYDSLRSRGESRVQIYLSPRRDALTLTPNSSRCRSSRARVQTRAQMPRGSRSSYGESRQLSSARCRRMLPSRPCYVVFTNLRIVECRQVNLILWRHWKVEFLYLKDLLIYMLHKLISLILYYIRGLLTFVNS